MQKGLVQHQVWQVKIGRNILAVEVALRAKSPSPIPVPLTQGSSIGREVPLTSDCKNQGGLRLSETEDFWSPGHSFQRSHEWTYSISSSGTAAQRATQLKRHQGHTGRNWIVWHQDKSSRTAFSQTDVLAETTVPLLSPPTTEAAGGSHIWVSIRILPSHLLGPPELLSVAFPHKWPVLAHAVQFSKISQRPWVKRCVQSFSTLQSCYIEKGRYLQNHL